MDAPDIRTEIERDLEDGEYPFSRLKTTLEPIYTLAEEKDHQAVNPAKEVIKTLKALQDTYFYLEDGGSSQALAKKLELGIDNISRRKLYTVTANSSTNNVTSSRFSSEK
jgi:hypothetical protein